MRSHGPAALLAVAHGSRDLRHAAVVASLISAVRAAHPHLRVDAAFLDHSIPSVPHALAALAADRVRHVIAVPLLLTPAYHAKTDLPRLLRRARRDHPALAVMQAPALGPHPLLVAALERRLREAGVWPGDPTVGVVLGAAGTSDPQARAAIARVAHSWRATGWAGVACAYASAGGPDVAQAAATLRRSGARRVVLAPYVLAPGVLPDRLVLGAMAARLDGIAEVVGAAQEVAALTIERYEQSAAIRTSA